MISDWLTKVFGQNYRSTIGGIMLGVPPLITAGATEAGYHLKPFVLMILTIITGLGALVLGINTKDKQVHSTQAEVQAATIEQKTAK